MSGYGKDTWCAASLVPGRFASGVQGVALALYRRITTPRGTLRGDDEERAYGVDVTEYLGSLGSEQAVLVLPAIVRAEMLKDDRVVDVKVEAELESNSVGEETITITAIVALDGGDEFTLTVGVDEADVALIGGVG